MRLHRSVTCPLGQGWDRDRQWFSFLSSPFASEGAIQSQEDPECWRETVIPCGLSRCGRRVCIFLTITAATVMAQRGACRSHRFFKETVVLT